MLKRLLILARDFNAARHWAKEQRLSLGRWVYVSSYHNIDGNSGCEYVKLPGFEQRVDADILLAKLEAQACKPSGEYAV
jgi:hypothetical protein